MKTEIRCQTTDDPKRRIHLLHKAGCPPDVIAHAQAVAGYAREIAVRYNKRHWNPADIELVVTGALLHDIGRSRSNGIDHAVVGAEIARSLGLDERIVRIIKRHIGAGIPKEEAERLGLPKEGYLPFTAMNCATSLVSYSTIVYRSVQNNGT